MRKLEQFGLTLLLLGVFSLVSATAYGGNLFPDGSVIKQKCAACHKPDPQGKLEVIEETRKTPEEWKVVVDRMIRLNSAPLDDADFNEVIKAVSKDLCLSPKEMAAVAYLNSDENSQYREIPRNKLEERIYTACVRCHTFGKIASHKNTTAQWGETRNLHLGYYPTTIPQMREMEWAVESKELIEPLAKLFPFDNSEWKEWLKNRKDQDLSGDWSIAGYQPGMGYYSGKYTLSANPSAGNDEYLIDRTVTYANGTTLKTSGKGTLFSGYHMRYALAPNALMGRVEGVFDLNSDQMGFKGKWWTEVQDTNAYGNEVFTKKGTGIKVIGAYPQAFKTGTTQALTIIGVDLPKISASDISFSTSGLTVSNIKQAGDSQIVCDVKVKSGAGTGVFALSVNGVKCANELKLYDKMDAIKVLPEIGRARVSCGPAYPPQGVQFVARGIDFGPDGKAGTADDLVLDPVDADWSLVEEKTRENDDDLKYVNAPVVNGLYTPVTTYGPIKGRVQDREGIGLIKIVASYDKLESNALLAVTVTDFITHIK